MSMLCCFCDKKKQTNLLVLGAVYKTTQGAIQDGRQYVARVKIRNHKCKEYYYNKVPMMECNEGHLHFPFMLF